MKGCFLHYADVRDESKMSGVEWKVRDQIDALNRAGLNCDFVSYDQSITLTSKVLACMPFFGDGVSWPDPKIFNGMDYLYMRRPRMISKDLLAFALQVKQANPQIRILMEFPTFPYDREYLKTKMLPALVKDRKHRRGLHACIDRIVDLSGAAEIFDVPTIPMHNGVNIDRIGVRCPRASGDNALDIAFVANFSKWHGADRMIKGLEAYYEQGGDRAIRLHLAGGGESLPGLRRLTEKCHLNDRVEFCGPLDSKELSCLYDKCTFAIASLGMHRIGIEVASTLKTREYLAKGMPFLYAGEVDVFQRAPLDLCLRAPADDSPIDIKGLIGFHDALYCTRSEQEVIDSIRHYAEMQIGIDAAMRDVIMYIRQSVDEGDLMGDAIRADSIDGQKIM